MNTKKLTLIGIYIIFGILSLIILPAVQATLILDRIQFDPAIISSGDEVDIVIQFHDTVLNDKETRIGNPEYNFQITLVPDDTVSKEYILIQNADGDNLYGTVYAGEQYNKKFRIKVNQNAPAGTYQFKLIGQWYFKGVPEDMTQEASFKMSVKKEGVTLGISNVVSSPDKIRSGDKDILLTTEIFNSGEKTAKNINVKLEYPQGISASYTNNNELNIGVIESMQKQNLQFYIDTDNEIKSGTYYIRYTIDYQDIDSNKYTKTELFPVVIKKKPYLKVIESHTTGLAGETAQLYVTIQNVGEEKAESADIRIIKQSSQPFEMDVRSSYLGQLKSGENATAVFTININRDAEIKSHSLNLALRAKGDSEQGDSNIYTYSDSATINVTGKKANNYPIYAAVFAILVIISAIIFYTKKPKKR